MITVERLTKSYGPHPVLSNVSFHVERGEVLGLLGPNGAGKTTTMRVLTGYLPATSGNVQVAGYDVQSHSLDVRRRVGYLPESVPLYQEMTVWGYLEFMAKVKGVPGRDREDQIYDAMERVQITNREDQIISKLSKGYRQRVGLAQALLGKPEVLILDEPTVGLDPRQIIETRELIKGLGGDHTVILSTHILPEVSMTCSRVVIINKGRTIAEDTPENLNRRLRGSESVHVTVRGPQSDVRQRLEKIPKVVGVTPEQTSLTNIEDACDLTVTSAPGSDVREAVASAVVTSGWGLLEMRPIGLSLEEIFLQLTTSEGEDEE